MKLCVAYCRVSTDSDDQRNSIEAQKDYYINLFSQDGYNSANVGMLYKKNGTEEKITGIFADEGISGTSLNRREAFKTMLEYGKKKAFDVIYVKSVSRFSRSTVDGINTIKDLRALGIAVIFEDCGINTLIDNKDFEIELRFMLANEESRAKSYAVKWGMKQLYRKGGWNGSAPYGYNVEKSFLKVNIVEAQIVEKIYDLYLNEGYGTGKIARYLNNKNITTKKNVKWSQKQIADILNNQIYTGIQVTHITETIDINRKIKSNVDKKDHIKHIFEKLRIISDDMYKLVQLEKEKRTGLYSIGKGHSNKQLLSTLLSCSCCGTYKRKKRHSYRRKDGTQLDIGYEWTCAINDMYGKNRCNQRNAVIETDMIEQIKQEIIKLKKSNMNELFELYLKVKFYYNISEETYSNLLKKKAKVDKKISNLRDDLADELINREEYKDQVKELLEDARGITSEIEKITRHDLDVDNARLKYKEFLDYVKNIDIDNLTNAGLKKIFKDIQIQAITYKNGVKFSYATIFNYYCLDMSETEIIKKAEEMGISYRLRVL